MIDTSSGRAETTSARLAQSRPSQRGRAADINLTVILIVGSLLCPLVGAQLADWQEARAQLLDQSSASAGTPPTQQQLNELVQAAARGPPASELDWIQMAAHAKPEVNKCREGHFRSLVALRKAHLETNLGRYLGGAIKSQRKWCEDYLNEEVAKRVRQLPEQSGRFFRLFLEHDRPGRDFYLTPEASISKLREVAEAKLSDGHTRDEFEDHFGPAVFDSCRDILSHLDDLEPIRRDHEIFARLPLKCEHNFRIHALCRNLLHFDLLQAIDQLLIHDVRMRSELIKFGRFLPQSESTGSSTALSRIHDSDEQVLEAALEYAYEFELSRRQRSSSSRHTQSHLLTRKQFDVVVNSLDQLQAICQTSVELLDNFLWLEDFAQFRAHSEHLTEARALRLNKYLRTLNACQRVAHFELTPSELIRQREVSRVSRKNLSLIKRISSLFIGRPKTTSQSNN